MGKSTPNSELHRDPISKKNLAKTNPPNKIKAFEAPNWDGLKKLGFGANLSAWVVNDVAFPHGTKFRGKYKDYFYFAEVVNGTLVLNDRPFLSPSAASFSITGKPVDGWLFWDCKLPDQSCWESIYRFKKAAQQV